MKFSWKSAKIATLFLLLNGPATRGALQQRWMEKGWSVPNMQRKYEISKNAYDTKIRMLASRKYEYYSTCVTKIVSRFEGVTYPISHCVCPLILLWIKKRCRFEIKIDRASVLRSFGLLKSIGSYFVVLSLLMLSIMSYVLFVLWLIMVRQNVLICYHKT